MNHQIIEQLARQKIHDQIHRNDRAGIRRSARLMAREIRASRRHAR